MRAGVVQLLMLDGLQTRATFPQPLSWDLDAQLVSQLQFLEKHSPCDTPFRVGRSPAVHGLMAPVM